MGRSEAEAREVATSKPLELRIRKSWNGHAINDICPDPLASWVGLQRWLSQDVRVGFCSTLPCMCDTGIWIRYMGDPERGHSLGMTSWVRLLDGTSAGPLLWTNPSSLATICSPTNEESRSNYVLLANAHVRTTKCTLPDNRVHTYDQDLGRSLSSTSLP